MAYALRYVHPPFSHHRFSSPRPRFPQRRCSLLSPASGHILFHRWAPTGAAASYRRCGGDSPAAEEPVSFERAVSLFNSGNYHRCHDFLEELWYEAEEPIRTILHGILQCAVGFYHLLNQNHRGAMMELGEGLCKLRKMGFENGPFLRFEQEISAALEFVYLTQKEFAASISSAADFFHDFDITWGGSRAKIINSGQLLTLSLDRSSGSGFQSKNEYLFGKIDMQLKLVPGNSAGTVTAYYFSSQGATHDEIDFEFLGNLSGDPYTLHTNVFTQGKGNREQQFHLWFDPTKNFHTYTILWNPRHVIFMVDGTPIRDFKNLESRGIAFPKSQPMRIYSSLWDAEDWATRGGLVKTDWSQAPFSAAYQNFVADACVWSSGASSCAPGKSVKNPANGAWWNQDMDATSEERMRWVQKNYMIYNYCTDVKRFPQGLPLECSVA